MNKEQRIEVGQIWRVTTNCFKTSGKKEQGNRLGRKIELIKNELIEIRYPYEWHFRTIDNIYYHAETNMILKNAVLFGEIYENVRFGNKTPLIDIIRYELYKRENTHPHFMIKDNDLMISSGEIGIGYKKLFSLVGISD